MGLLANERWERFAQGLAKGLSQTEAYTKAGYDGDVTAASRLSRNVNIKSRVAEILGRAAERAEITQEMVLRELAKIGFADMRKLLRWTGNLPVMDVADAEATGDVKISVANFVSLFDSEELDDDIVGAISEISQTREGAIKVKLHDKQQALVNIGKHLGMFKERVELTGKDGGPIETEDLTGRADAFTSGIARLAARGDPSSASGETEH